VESVNDLPDDNGQMLAFLRSGRQEPSAREDAGLHSLEVSVGNASQDMVVPKWGHEPSGRVSAGMIAILSDSTLGAAAMSTLPITKIPVTTALHITMSSTSAETPAELHAAASITSSADGELVAGGIVTDSNGLVLASITMRAMVVDVHRDRPSSAATSSPHVAQEPITVTTIDEFIGAQLTGGPSRFVEAQVKPRFANGYGNVHGGYVAMLLERALHLGSVDAAEGAALRLCDLVVSYVRPIKAVDQRIRLDVALSDRTRRFLFADASLKSNGRQLAIARAGYINPPS
jgi:acyl-coenzyme A thioesterase PaaI-like protein